MRTILFDATRLFMRASLGSPTGIDRVTDAYARWLLNRPEVELIPVCSLGGVASPMSRAWFENVLLARTPRATVESADWPRLMAALNSNPPAPQALRARPTRTALAGPVPRYAAFGLRALTRWRPATPPSGALFVNVSHFGLEQPGLLEHLSRRGVRALAMVHDLIPLTHPEYCSPPAERWHRRRIEALLRNRARILANSGATAADLTAFARANALPDPHVRVAPLGLEPAFLTPADRPPPGRPYFVCVGTLEPRKNLAFLLTVWRRLAETLGEATPPLVLAGRRGWENEAIIDLLERAATVRRFVHEVPGLDDKSLARLMAGASALLAPSFAEGFNLPVAEAAALGVSVIASDIPAHRELAAQARLLDPLDGPAWLAAIMAAATDPARPSPRAPFSWSDHFAIAAEAMEL